MPCKITDEQLDLVAQKFLCLYSIDDVLEGTADEDTIRYYCAVAANKLHCKEILPPKLLQCLTTALYQISKGGDPTTVFQLNKPGRKPQKDFKPLIALCVWHLVKGYSYKVIPALNQIADYFEKDYSTVRDIYYRYRRKINIEYEQILLL